MRRLRHPVPRGTRCATRRTACSRPSSASRPATSSPPLTVPAASPVLAVGSTVIDLTPDPAQGVGDPAVRHRRQADPGRLGDWSSCCVLAAVAGIARRATARGRAAGPRRRWPASPACSPSLRPECRPARRSFPPWSPPSSASASLWWLHRADDRSSQAAAAGTAAARPGAGSWWPPAVSPRPRWPWGRRSLGRRRTARAATDIALPAAADPAPAFPPGLEETYDGITPLRTPDRRLLPGRHPARPSPSSTSSAGPSPSTATSTRRSR